MDWSSPFSARSDFNDVVMKGFRNSLSRIKRVGIIQDPFFDLGGPVFFIESKFIVQTRSLKIKIDGNNSLPELRKIFCYVGNCESSPNSAFIRVESDGLQRDSLSHSSSHERAAFTHLADILINLDSRMPLSDPGKLLS